MIRSKKKLEQFYKKLIEEEDLTYQQALIIFESLRQEAVAVGAIHSGNILEGLETDLRIARTLNNEVK